MGRTNADDVELEAALQQLLLDLRSDAVETDVGLGEDGVGGLCLGHCGSFAGAVYSYVRVRECWDDRFGGSIELMIRPRNRKGIDGRRRGAGDALSVQRGWGDRRSKDGRWTKVSSQVKRSVKSSREGAMWNFFAHCYSMGLSPSFPQQTPGHNFRARQAPGVQKGGNGAWGLLVGQRVSVRDTSDDWSEGQLARGARTTLSFGCRLLSWDFLV
jgi:hypothetical protein